MGNGGVCEYISVYALSRENGSNHVLNTGTRMVVHGSEMAPWMWCYVNGRQ